MLVIRPLDTTYIKRRFVAGAKIVLPLVITVLALVGTILGTMFFLISTFQGWGVLMFFGLVILGLVCWACWEIGWDELRKQNIGSK